MRTWSSPTCSSWQQVVEILSPTGTARDQVLKRKLYSKYGVKEYWMVDPEGRTVEVLALMETGLQTWQVFPVGSALRSPLLPGFSLQVDDLFRS
jgi:Uma2 family endonuclease